LGPSRLAIPSLASDRLYAVGAKALELAPPPPGILLGLRPALRRRGQDSSASSASVGASSLASDRLYAVGAKALQLEPRLRWVPSLASDRLYAVGAKALELEPRPNPPLSLSSALRGGQKRKERSAIPPW
jgi:hypothetical protein